MRRLRRLVAALPALSAAALLAISASAAELRGSVEVRGRAGDLLGARGGQVVTLVAMDSGATAGRVLTDRLGRFRFPDVPPGRYRLTIGYPTPLRELVIAVPDTIALELPPIPLPASP